MSPRGYDGFRGFAIPVLRGAVVLALVTFAAYQLHLNTAAAGFLYLIAVALNCLDSGFVPAAIVSVLAVACLDYFFVEPILTWTVADPVDVVALASLLVTSLVVTRLASRAREEAKTAQRERQNLKCLYEAAQRLLGWGTLGSEHSRVLETFRQVFGLKAACLFDASTAELYTAGDAHRTLGDRTRETYILGRGLDEPAEGLALRPLRASGKTVGAIGFLGLDDPSLMADHLAALAAAGLERASMVSAASYAAAEAKAEGLRAAILDALAHEFKTPLATILTAAGGLRAAGPLDGAQMELAELVETEAERLSNLSSRLLRLARLDSEEVKPRLEPSDLVSIVGRAVHRYSNQWPERQFLLRSQGQTMEVMADANLFQLAVSQLLDNACRYSPADSAVKVTVEFGERSAYVIVWNSGAPISPAEGTRIFERFYRGSGAQQVSSGTGLGLYVARKIAVAHGGSLDLDADRVTGGGVAFRLTLPLVLEGSDLARTI